MIIPYRCSFQSMDYDHLKRYVYFSGAQNLEQVDNLYNLSKDRLDEGAEDIWRILCRKGRCLYFSREDEISDDFHI
jgi:hypothetical protein